MSKPERIAAQIVLSAIGAAVLACGGVLVASPPETVLTKRTQTFQSAPEPSSTVVERTEAKTSDALIGAIFGIGAALLLTGLVLPRIQSIKSGVLEVTFGMDAPKPTEEEKRRIAARAAAVLGRDSSAEDVALLALAAEDAARSRKEQLLLAQLPTSAEDFEALAKLAPSLDSLEAKPPELSDTDVVAVVAEARGRLAS
jgi:hypothetical protein